MTPYLGQPFAAPLLGVVFAVGLVGGGLSGLLGIGGGIVAAPLLLYAPPLFGLPPLGMHDVSGLTITQALFAGLLGMLVQRGAGTIDRRLALVVGGAIAACSFAGAAASKFLPAQALLGLFILLALVAALLLVSPLHAHDAREYAPGRFSAPRAATIGAGIGLLGGLVGQGGSFVLIPLMMTLLGIPTRIAMATNLPIVAAASLAGFAGKALTGQVPLLPALALVAGVAPGVLAGARMGQRASGRTLRLILAGVIVAACARMAFDLVR